MSKVREHWVVVGPTGIFVVGRAENDVAASAEHTLALAHELRERLGEVTPWVPFVDALVVADREVPDSACTIVDVDMLVRALTVGAPTLDDAALVTLRRHLPTAAAQLSPGGARPLDPA